MAPLKWTLMIAGILALSLGLSACGKKGNPNKPEGSSQRTYPSY